MNAAGSLTPEEWGAIKDLLAEIGTLSGADREARLRALTPEQAAMVRPFLDVDTGVLARPAVGLVEVTAYEEVIAGRYRIERPLGRGGMGTVDLAHDLTLDCPVAIKRLRNLWLPDAEARRRLVHEARALAALNHPHVARVQDVLDTSPPALVMEYVEGDTLAGWLEEPRPAAAVLEVVRQVAGAVAYAHGRGVVHCDLKPGNVLVTREGQAKVVDFGIAQMQRTAATTRLGDTTSAPAFTPRYAAPEVKQGARPVPASDVYSLGVLLEEVVDDCARAGAPLPRPIADRLRRASASALAFEVERRPQDGAAFLASLPAESHETRPESWRTRAATALIVLGGCVSGGVAITGDGGAARASSLTAGAPTFAVVARVDEASTGTMSSAAADLLRRSLGTLTQARLVTADVPALKEDVGTLVKDLKFAGLTYVLVPSVSPSADGVRVSVAVRRANDGQVVHTATATGSADAMGAIVQRLSGQVRQWLGEAPAASTAGPMFEPSARSLAEYSQARQYVERPDKKDALSHARGLLERAVQREPAFAAAHAELARVLVLQYRERRDPALIVQAQAASGKAMRLDPGLVEARIAHATTLQATGQRADAISELKAVLAIAPDQDRAMRLLGQLQAATGQADEGIRTLRALVERYPAWMNYRALGTVLFDAGRYLEAEQLFHLLTELQPENPWGYQMLGTARQQQKKLQEAERAYRQSIALDETAAAVSNLALFHYQQGRYAEAEAGFSRAAKLAPSDAAYLRNLGDLRLRLGRSVEARSAYRRAQQLLDSEVAINPTPGRWAAKAYLDARLGDCTSMAASAGRASLETATNSFVLADGLNALVLCDRFDLARPVAARLVARGEQAADVLEWDVLRLEGTIGLFTK